MRYTFVSPTTDQRLFIKKEIYPHSLCPLESAKMLDTLPIQKSFWVYTYLQAQFRTLMLIVLFIYLH